MNQRFMMVYAMMLTIKAAFAWMGERFDGRRNRHGSAGRSLGH